MPESLLSNRRKPNHRLQHSSSDSQRSIDRNPLQNQRGTRSPLQRRNVSNHSYRSSKFSCLSRTAKVNPIGTSFTTTTTTTTTKKNNIHDADTSAKVTRKIVTPLTVDEHPSVSNSEVSFRGGHVQKNTNRTPPSPARMPSRTTSAQSKAYESGQTDARLPPLDDTKSSPIYSQISMMTTTTVTTKTRTRQRSAKSTVQSPHRNSASPTGVVVAATPS